MIKTFDFDDGQHFRANGALMFKLCIDRMCDGDMEGRIFSGYARPYIAFDTLDAGMAMLERVVSLARSGVPCEEVFSEKNGLQPPPTDKIVRWSSSVLYLKTGALGSAYLIFDCNGEQYAMGSLSVILRNRTAYFTCFKTWMELKSTLLAVGTVFSEHDTDEDIRKAFRALHEQQKGDGQHEQ